MANVRYVKFGKLFFSNIGRVPDDILRCQTKKFTVSALAVAQMVTY